MNDPTPLRIGVVGNTPLARQFLAALDGRIPGVIAVALSGNGVDVDNESGEAGTLAGSALDAVIVASSTAARAATVAAAVERGLHVCCPLPVVADLPTLDALIVRAAQAGVIAFAPNLLRYMLPVTQLYEARRTVGKPAALFAAHRTRYSGDGDGGGDGSGGNGDGDGNSGGGDLFAELALPLVDLAMWIVGGEVERVQVMAERLFAPEHTPEGADTALMLLRFAGGLTATLEAARSLPATAPHADELLVEYLGLDAVLRATPANLAVTVIGRAGVRAESLLATPASAVAEAFVAAIRGGQGAPQSLVDARWSLAVLEKIRLAAVTGEMVRVGGAVRR